MAAASVTVPCTTTMDEFGELETMNVELDLDLHVTQVVEPVGKKEDDVTKHMMSLCADDAATRGSQGSDGTDGR